MSEMAAAVEASPLMQIGLWLMGVGFVVGSLALLVLAAVAGWATDRVWVWENRAEMTQIDRDMLALDATKERLDTKMMEMFGPDWRREAERRFAARFPGLRWD